MRNNIIVIFTIMCTLHIPTVASAGRNASLYGLGNDSCGELLEAFTQHAPFVALRSEDFEWPSKSYAYLEWTLGFITAFNMANSQSKNLENADSQGVAAWMRKWCSDHPMDSVGAAAWDLIRERTGYNPSRDKDKRK